MPGYFFTDHRFIEATLHLKRPDPPLKKITYRKIKAINQSEFHNKLASVALDLIHDPSTSLSEMVTTYNMTLNTVLDEFTPVQTNTIRTLHHQPWFNDTIKAEIILWRKKERTWLTELSEYSWNAFYNQQWYVANLTKTAQSNYYTTQIAEHKHNFKTHLQDSKWTVI